MDTATTTRNPFDIPELRHQLSQFLPNKDAISCALVSKAWTLDFVRTIWFQIEFEIHPQFVDLSPDIVAKHGRNIRVVKNAITLEEVSALNHVNVNSLRHLEIGVSTTPTQQENAYQVITRNNTNLQALILLRIVNYSYSILPQHSIESLTLSYSGLESILQICINLAKLRLPHVTLTGSPNRPFQHMGITLFSFGLKIIFHEGLTRPSMLSHFPNLTTLDTWHNISEVIVSSSRINAEILRYCPLLTQYKLKYFASSITPVFLANAATNVMRITFEKDEMVSETISAIILHRATLTKVALFCSYGYDYEMDKVNPVSLQIAASNKMLQLIPRSCTHLKRLNPYPYEMDMDVVEAAEWVCKDLRKLRIRVKGLDTKERILKTIAFWRAGCWRRWQKNATGVNAAVAVDGEEKRLEEDHSIEARVARHLLKFEQLWWVWLGYKTWTPI
ncbi:hypothetical protein BGZ95_006295 [Linnemannia exigua]|uniref:F-box domain-containing protein n=1 Tax=Linnemannia exigua TaxID=604196 RepID=A0AAD4DHX1_9FUNG|nr:hypothetical protein BGZ95_006295 [Linnemannia exigua]